METFSPFASRCRWIGGHLLRASRRSGGNPSERGGDGEKIFDSVAHLAREQFAVFLRKPALGYIEKDSEHAASNLALLIAMSARRDPPDLVSVRDAEVDFKGAKDIARRRERRANAVQVLRMDAGR